jgi:hypothetical protein
MLYVLSGEHNFQFEPSKITPGGTTFTHWEIPLRFNILFMTIIPAQKIFDQFSRSFKARVELVNGKAKAAAE